MVLIPTVVKQTKVGSRAADLYVLNATGQELWAELREPRDEGDLAQKLRDVYDVDAAQAMTDVREFLASMLEIEAIRPMDGEG
jgi:hypothetical protein